MSSGVFDKAKQAEFCLHSAACFVQMRVALLTQVSEGVFSSNSSDMHTAGCPNVCMSAYSGEPTSGTSK